MADEMTFMDPKEQLPVDEEPIGKSSAFEMIHWMNRQLKNTMIIRRRNWSDVLLRKMIFLSWRQND